ncbi:ubiquitin-like protein 3b isoform X1 [Xiphias gladius]|uniref:ubiquitin-like protein 3b isoform X1 n=1 Tax=Xiphias gladius TaxID=8245 RepID=UPI001A985FAD|nr:ubiquitin-like protein 3b isoform X1 [Xiphias gladius]
MTTQRDLDMVHLRLILVSGKTQDFTFSPNDSATDIAKHVFENWPAGWEEERVSSPSILRLIFQGRFLHGNVTLGDEGVITRRAGGRGVLTRCVCLEEEEVLRLQCFHNQTGTGACRTEGGLGPTLFI